MDVLFFYPSSNKSDAGRVPGILQNSSPDQAQVNLEVLDENSPAPAFEDKNYAAIIIFYTSGLERSGTLFEIVRYIDQRKPPGRFIFLPDSGGKKTLPPIFHLIRSQLHRLFYYPASGQSPNLLETQLEPFQSAWQEFSSPARVELPPNARRVSKDIPFWLTVLFSAFIIILAGLTAELIPTGLRFLPVPTPSPTALQPPPATAFWLQESFQDIDSSTRWKLQHYYSGRKALQTNPAEGGLSLSAAAVVTEAVFQLDSRQSWPLDQFESLAFTFRLSALDDPSARNALNFGLYLSEDNSLRVECLIIPAETDGRIQCQVKSPNGVEALSGPIQLSLDTRHTASLVFVPRTYTLQFFLDDHFYGQREIQSVADWRGRNFNLQVTDRVQNLNSADYHCELDGLNLAHTP